MRTLTPFLSSLVAFVVASFVPIALASAQEPEAPEGATIGSAQVSGFSIDRLSPGLRQDINALVGEPLNRDGVTALARRIEAEQPEVVAAVRTTLAASGEARVVFLVARISENRDLEENINARYLVQSVELEGVPLEEVSQTLRDDLQKLIGNNFDREEAERLEERLRDEVPNARVSRRMSRGDRPGQIRLVFSVRKPEAARLVPFVDTPSKLIFHSDEGWSGVLDAPIGGRDNRVSIILAGDNGDDLVEEYSGFGFRYEGRNVGTERLGLSLEYSRYESQYRNETLLALALPSNAVVAALPPLYEVRSTVAPGATFAITPNVRVTGGLSITELAPETDLRESQMANAATFGVGYDNDWSLPKRGRQNVTASFLLRSATGALDSDLEYTRYFTTGQYLFRRGPSRIIANASAGRINGNAPLFERFTLGDSTTLRGWNKWDVAPVGGSRMFHTSIEYRIHFIALFMDMGSVWDVPSQKELRYSTGFGLHFGDQTFTLGIPLNADDVDATFIVGIRF